MGNFAENLNLGNRFRPPLAKIRVPPPFHQACRRVKGIALSYLVYIYVGSLVKVPKLVT